MTVPDSIEPEEDLGRSVFSSQQKKRAQRSTVPYHVFLEREGEIKLSVDRLSRASEEELVSIARNVAEARNRKFYGWAVVSAKLAHANEREVVSTPQPDNPYHADILLPILAADDREEQIRHAKELADNSKWSEPDF